MRFQPGRPWTTSACGRRPLALLLSTAILFGSPLSAERKGSDANLTTMSTRSESEMLREVNKIRTRENLPPLVASVPTVRMAQEQAEDMAQRGYFSHDRPAFSDRRSESFGERVRRYRIRASAAENIGTSSGYSADESLEKALEGWMRSPGHRRNLLNPQFRSTGIGHYRWSERVPKRNGYRLQWRDMWVQTFSSAVPTD